MTVAALVPTPSNPSADQATRLRALARTSPSAHCRPQGPEGVARGSARAGGGPVSVALAPHPTRIIAIASGKGGVGKTNLAVNLSIALASLGFRTTLLDADLGTANADVLCGLMPAARLEHVFRSPVLLSDSAAGRSLADIAVDAPGGFRLIPGSAGVARMADLPAPDRARMIDAIADLECASDVVIIDTAAGVGPSVLDFLYAADLALVVATPEPTAIADAYALIKCLHTGRFDPHSRRDGAPEPAVRLVVNQAQPHEAAAVHARIAAVCLRFLGLSLPLAGSVAQDLRILSAVRQRTPLLLHAPAAQASRDILCLARAMAQQMDISPSTKPEQPRRSRLPGLLARLRLA